MQNASYPTSRYHRRILILGGTSEASQLASRLAGRTELTVISSLAGRVMQPALPAGVVRIGGFGGAQGLTSYLAKESIDVVIDATHPFAARISQNAELACNSAHVPLICFERPPWTQGKHDRWIVTHDARGAALLSNRKENRVFLSIGRQELGAFSDCKEAWFLVRSIDEPADRLPANSKLILQRGPFDLEDECKLLCDEAINIIVSKNSGGAATFSKIEAARELQIPIVMIERLQRRQAPALGQLDEVLSHLDHFLETMENRPTSAGEIIP